MVKLTIVVVAVVVAVVVVVVCCSISLFSVPYLPTIPILKGLSLFLVPNLLFHFCPH